MNNFAEQLKKTGVQIKDPISKVDSSKSTIKSRIEAADKFLTRANKAIDHIEQASDHELSYSYIESAVLNYQRYCEVVKDILIRVCDHQGIALSSNKSLSEVIRKTEHLLNIPRDTQEAIRKITIRNSLVHDYMNSEYYDDQVIDNLVNDSKQYKIYLSTIERYCKNIDFINK